MKAKEIQKMIESIPNIEAELKEFQDKAREVQVYYTRQTKIPLSNQEAYWLTLWLNAKYWNNK